MSIIDKFNKRANQVNSLVCVGLDSAFERLAQSFQQDKQPQFTFNRHIIEQTAPYAAAFKCNIAFYEARGELGLHDLKLTIDYLRENYPEIVTICDAKRADIGNTNRAYTHAIFDELGFDAITLHPYLGKEALQPFLERQDKASIILCHTSNPGAEEFQELSINGQSLWQIVAKRVTEAWNTHNNCMLVIGATYPTALRKARELCGDMTFLVPGVGAQGGDIQAVVSAGVNSEGKGLIINSSRGIIFAKSPSQSAKNLRDAINQHR